MNEAEEKLLIFNRLRRLLKSCYTYGDEEGCVYLDVASFFAGRGNAEKTATEIKNTLIEIRDFGKEKENERA